MPSPIGPGGHDHTEEAAMERHAALPDLEDGERVGEIMGQIEQHIAEPAAQHHAEGGPEQEIVELVRRDRRAARFP